MPRFAFAIAAICVLSTLEIPATAAEWPICSGRNRAARHVTCVVDGDKWWQNGVKYRLACVDAVELDDVRGIEARDEPRQLLGQADTRVRGLGFQDPYRRSFAIIVMGVSTSGRILVSRELAERKNYRDTRNWFHRL
jgi:endonuclease YncB( thermonuclease family)